MSGWQMGSCEQKCPSDEPCKQQCRCQNDGKCNFITGECECTPGWTGEVCANSGCGRTCECGNGAGCHHVTGQCQCEAGFTGEKCTEACPPGQYGAGCAGRCACEHGGEWSCLCAPGYRGLRCEEPCPAPQYGDNCAHTCHCHNNATCSHETGHCDCPPGFDGLKCDRPCDGKTYGLRCRQPCNCENDAPCNPVNGECLCGAGYTGARCERRCAADVLGKKLFYDTVCDNSTRPRKNEDITNNLIQVGDAMQVLYLSLKNSKNNGTKHDGKKLQSNEEFYKGAFNSCLTFEFEGVRCETQCPAGRYGEQCSERCPCANNSSCDAGTGRCQCAAGWRGPHCDQPCPPNHYGAGCLQMCPESPDGNTTCDPVSGEYSCPSGFTGLACEFPCPLGTYGLHCAHKCDCKNGADCHHVTGECQCLPGWRGARCGEACPAGWWGAACSQPCRCARGAACRPNDGYCRCPPGYTGNYCTQFCPEGYFGDHCMEACACPARGSWQCEPVRGCVCRRGYVGEHCDTHAADAIHIDHAAVGSSNAGLTTVMVIMVLLCAAAAILVLLYYRKRVRNLKREIAHVHYTADPNQPPEQHFDNPVYSFQGSTRSDESASTLLNNSNKIFNNLNAAKLNNATLEKLRMTASSSSDTYDPLSSLKNKDADATNPNLYHCIDDDKLDHVYDEIKHKEGYEMEYDHLNYTPPANTWKPHYQRMNNDLPAVHRVQSYPHPEHPEHPSAVALPTPPIPPLPKLNMTPIPPPRAIDSIEVPVPPKREEGASCINDEENQTP
ncbi:PREDICTED: multiple epidermal growth factor-like domains protein 6 [Papilio polytes]|uniref:multiple epidermal growth factor-like domains protein 6 n=1 Tax=Papilio polytes TaxID=76194 RepID=UPI0006764EDE|nr:PREDICTED: multiple epidermal growth factor-like domains protein 6 [Papilio polytes]